MTYDELMDAYMQLKGQHVKLEQEIQRYDPEQPAYTIEQAMTLARLWRSGKLVGGDAKTEVIFALLAGLEAALLVPPKDEP